MSLSAVCTILSGRLITLFGYYQPLLTIGSIFTTIGAGLLYTLDVNLNTGHFIRYQLLVGIGVGLAIQVPVIASQASSGPMDIPLVTATVLCKNPLLSHPGFRSHLP